MGSNSQHPVLKQCCRVKVILRVSVLYAKVLLAKILKTEIRLKENFHAHSCVEMMAGCPQSHVNETKAQLNTCLSRWSGRGYHITVYCGCQDANERTITANRGFQTADPFVNDLYS